MIYLALHGGIDADRTRRASHALWRAMWRNIIGSDIIIIGDPPYVVAGAGNHVLEFPDYDTARQDPALSSLTWVYMDPGATMFLDEYTHPADDVVYAIGADDVGFDNHTMNGTRLKIRMDPNDWAPNIPPILFYDRMLSINGLR